MFLLTHHSSCLPLPQPSRKPQVPSTPAGRRASGAPTPSTAAARRQPAAPQTTRSKCCALACPQRSPPQGQAASASSLPWRGSQLTVVVCICSLSCREAPLQAWHTGIARDQKVSEEHRPFDTQAAVCTPGRCTAGQHSTAVSAPRCAILPADSSHAWSIHNAVVEGRG